MKTKKLFKDFFDSEKPCRLVLIDYAISSLTAGLLVFLKLRMRLKNNRKVHEEKRQQVIKPKSNGRHVLVVYPAALGFKRYLLTTKRTY